MAVVQTLIGNVKGPQGDTGATGAQGAQGDAATIEVGSVTTAAYGTAASVTNSGTTGAAILDFVIPQGAPGETVTDMQNLTLGAMTSSSDEFPTPTVGETGKVIFGKIVKWFSDMAALVATKFDASNVVNNLTTTASGYALDARQGKALNDKFSTVNLTTSLVNKGYIASRALFKSGDIYHLQLTLNSGVNGLYNVADLPTDAEPFQRLPLAVNTSAAADASKVVSAFIDGSSIYIFTNAATTNNVVIAGSWVKY